MSTTVGYNFYRGGVKVNDNLSNGSWAFRGLTPSTQVSDIAATAVSMAGVESPATPFSATTQGPVAANPAMSSSDSAVVDAIVAGCPASGGRTGCMVYVDGPKGEYLKAYGTSDGTNPMTTDMHFRIASLSKSLTAMAVLRAIDMGLLSLDDTINKFISNIPNGNLCTIRNLLMMRSGLFSDQNDTNYGVAFFVTPGPAGFYGLMSSMLYIRRGATSFLPGQSYLYENTNYFLLGIILERVMGRTLQDIVENDIMVPLGMTQSSCPTYPTTALPTPFTHGYGANYVTGSIQDYTVQNPDYLFGSGACVMNIADMMTWGKAMRDGQLLSPNANALWMNTFQIADGQTPVFSYGLGRIRINEWYGHDGSWCGFSTACVFHQPSGTVICVMENAQTNGLTAWSTIMMQIAEHFYPGSTIEPAG